MGAEILQIQIFASPTGGKASLFSRLQPVLSHTAAGLAGAFVVQVVGKARGGGVPGKSLGFGFKLDLGVPEGRGQVGVHAVDFERQPAGQPVAAALLVDERLTY